MRPTTCVSMMTPGKGRGSSLMRCVGTATSASSPLMPQAGFAHEDVDLHRGADEGALRRFRRGRAVQSRVARDQRRAIRGPPALLWPVVDEARGRLADGADATLQRRLRRREDDLTLERAR